MLATLLLTLLNREASLPKNQPDRVMEGLHLQKGDAVADLGSGGGYFTLEFAKRVGGRGIPNPRF